MSFLVRSRILDSSVSLNFLKISEKRRFFCMESKELNISIRILYFFDTLLTIIVHFTVLFFVRMLVFPLNKFCWRQKKKEKKTIFWGIGRHGRTFSFFFEKKQWLAAQNELIVDSSTSILSTRITWKSFQLDIWKKFFLSRPLWHRNRFLLRVVFVPVTSTFHVILRRLSK